MLSFQPVSSSSQAAHYFESADDYYEKEGHRGEWIGAGAEELGLTLQQQVDRESFKNILDGKLPNGLKVRFSDLRKDDRKGTDYTFSAPKSVSLQALIAGDKAVTAAHDRAVVRAVQQLEKLAHARKKEKGQSYRIRTGVIVAAAFRHELSRAQDPQLHTHVIVANLTKRPDGEWRALSNEDMRRSIKPVGAYYRAALAEELRAAGYELRETRGGYWELAHIGDDLIQHYSTRARQIEEAFSAHGLNRETASTSQAQALTLMTRSKKSEVDRALLREEWIASARTAGLDVDSLTMARNNARPVDPATLRADPKVAAQAKNAVNFAIEHLGERQGLFTRNELIEAAISKASTGSTIEAVMRDVSAAERDGRLVRELPLYQTARSLNQAARRAEHDKSADKFMDAPETAKLTRATWIGATMHARGMSEEQATAEVDRAIARGALMPTQPRYTTPEAQAIERGVLAIERDGRGAVEPIHDAADLGERLSRLSLNEGQRDAVGMILSTSNRFVGVQGYAGTGKSHMLSQAIDQITQAAARHSREQGYNVIGLAPYASQVHALEELGVQSKTLASFLISRKAQESLNEKSVVVLDEAGVVPAHQLMQIMRAVERAGARMVMLGDRKQTGAVEAGKPFAQLQDAGMTQAQLRDIQRQRDPEIRAAVLNAAQDHTSTALKQLGQRVREVPDAAERYRAIVKDFLASGAKERANTLIVAGTNEARHEINAQVRAGLKLAGGQRFEVLERVDATRAQLKEPSTYADKNLLVSYIRDSHGVERDKLYSVSTVVGDKVILDDGQGKIVEVDPRQKFAATLGKRYDIEIAPGDVLRITKTDHKLGLANGERVAVRSVSAQAVSVVTEKGAVVDIPANGRPLNVQHGYASTVHSAQGLTANRVLIDANTRSLTTNRAVFYVAISRPRNDLKLYTDSAKDLYAAVARVPKKFAALELRTPHTESHVAGLKHHQITVNRLRRLNQGVQRKAVQPQAPIEAGRNATAGRAR